MSPAATRPGPADRVPGKGAGGTGGLRTVTFKATAEVLAALAELEARLGGHIRKKRSAAIRKALLEAAAVGGDGRRGRPETTGGGR